MLSILHCRNMNNCWIFMIIINVPLTLTYVHNSRVNIFSHYRNAYAFRIHALLYTAVACAVVTPAGQTGTILSNKRTLRSIQEVFLLHRHSALYFSFFQLAWQFFLLSPVPSASDARTMQSDAGFNPITNSRFPREVVLATDDKTRLDKHIG